MRRLLRRHLRLEGASCDLRSCGRRFAINARRARIGLRCTRGDRPTEEWSDRNRPMGNQIFRAFGRTDAGDAEGRAARYHHDPICGGSKGLSFGSRSLRWRGHRSVRCRGLRNQRTCMRGTPSTRTRRSRTRASIRRRSRVVRRIRWITTVSSVRCSSNWRAASSPRPPRDSHRPQSFVMHHLASLSRRHAPAWPSCFHPRALRRPPSADSSGSGHELTSGLPS